MRRLLPAVAALMLAACSSDDTGGESKNPTDPGTADSGSSGPSKLSSAFMNLCATCHGPEGRGKDTYPSIPGSSDEGAYITRVRSGRGTMPAFDTSLISDADLEADYAWLTLERD